jgi:two-component system sensor histidine kinase CreC
VSTTTRILLGFLALLAAGAVGLLPVILERVGRQYLEAAEEPMVDTANILAAIIGQHVNESGALDLSTIRAGMTEARERKVDAQIYNVAKTGVTTHLYVTDRHGVVLFDSEGGSREGKDFSSRRDVRLTLLGEYGARSTRLDPQNQRTSTMFVAAPIRHGDEIIGVATVSKPTSAMYAFIDETRSWIRGLLFGFLGLVTLGAVLVTILFSGPIRRLAGYARSVARGERVAPPRGGSPDVAMLTCAFEEMRDALENRNYVETYVQTLTHEMKSPVAAIRGAAELLREGMTREQQEKFLDNIQAESRRLQLIIDRLLALSAIEVRKSLEKPEMVSLTKIASAVCDELKDAAGCRGITFELNADPNVRSMTGERFLLELALTNLLQNAIDFSPSGGVVRVRVGESDSNGSTLVAVEDEGPGIPDYAMPRVFDRFYSLQHPSTGRKSSGLGLCFVREIAELHGGTVNIVNRTDGPGARATMCFGVSSRK